MDVEHFAIESAGRVAEVDLCSEHAGELTVLLDTFPNKRRRGRRTIDVVDVADIPKKAPPSPAKRRA